MTERKTTGASLPLKTLPIDERWDCHGCGQCCHGTIINLDAADLARLGSQQWEKHPELAGTAVVRRASWLGRHRVLARRADGYCVFLTPQGRCRIHEEHGEQAKPWMCRMFPLQVVRLDQLAYVTSRRSCPSAAADSGRPVAEHVAAVGRLLNERGVVIRPAEAPRITGRRRFGWKDVQRVAESIERLLVDHRFSPVRRLVHGLHFCRLLDECRLKRLDSRALGELLALLESSAVEGAGDVFRDRQQPTRAAAGVFRQVALEHVRLHPRYVIRESWGEKWRLLWAAYRFARGKGRLPYLHASLPEMTFDVLDQPLGHLSEELIEPVVTYFETAVTSRQYMLLGRSKWSITESYRALALSYAVVMWLIRLTSTGREPTLEDSLGAVGAVDRAAGLAALCGRRHRHRVAGLEQLGQLERLIAWYAR